MAYSFHQSYFQYNFMFTKSINLAYLVNITLTLYLLIDLRVLCLVIELKVLCLVSPYD